MTLPVVILGAGGHARVLLDALQRMGMTVAGYAAKDEVSQLPRSIRRLGNDGAVEALDPATVMLANGIGSVRRPDIRQEAFLRFRQRGFRFVSVVHPAAVIGSDVVLAEGVQVMAGAVLQPGVTVGENAIVNTGAIIDHGCRIDAHAHLAPGTVLSGDVQVGEASHLGTGCRVIQGIRIGRQALVAAGAVVIADVADGVAVAGVPARPMLERREATAL